MICLEVNFQSHYHQPRGSARGIQRCSANSIPDVIAQDLVETQTCCILRLGKCNSTIRSPRSLLRSVSWDVKSDSLQPRQRGACKRGSRWQERETRLASKKPGRRRGEAGCKRGKEESPGKVGSSFLPCFSRCSPSDIERGYRMYSRYPSTYSSLNSPGPLALDGKHWPRRSTPRAQPVMWGEGVRSTTKYILAFTSLFLSFFLVSCRDR